METADNIFLSPPNGPLYDQDRMNSPVKLFFSAVVALGTLALPQAHSTLIDFNGAGTSEFGSNFIQSGTAFTETPGVGIGGTDGLTFSGLNTYVYGSAVYTAESFDLTGSTPVTASVLFYFQGLPADGITHFGSNIMVRLSILLDPQTDVTSRFDVTVWAPSPAVIMPGPLGCFFAVHGSSNPIDKASFGSEIKLVPGHWYRLTAGFANESDAFRISGKIEDFGTSGLQSVSVLSEGSWRNAATFPETHFLTTRDSVLAADSSTYIRMHAGNPDVVTALDNFEVHVGQVPEPSSAALLACAGLFVLNRRRATRGVAR